MKDERRIRSLARDIIATIADMRATTQGDARRFSVLSRRLSHLTNDYLAAGGPPGMEAMIQYGKR